MLPFKLGELAGFRVMQVFPDGGVILTDGPGDDINQAALHDRLDRARLAGDSPTTAPGLPATC